jgi:hypothetical protein
MINNKDKELIEKYRDDIELFKKFCINSSNISAADRFEVGNEPYDEVDFYDLSLGFFAARGINIPDTFSLAIICRYDFGYWC